MAHSSSGQGHRPLKAEITGSNPVCATTPLSLYKRIKESLAFDLDARDFVIGDLMVTERRMLGCLDLGQEAIWATLRALRWTCTRTANDQMVICTHRVHHMVAETRSVCREFRAVVDCVSE